MKKKSQISFEFIMIFSLVLFALIGFIYLIKVRMTEIGEEQEKLAMRNLANTIKSEVLLATSVHNRYLRRFEIPYKLEGKDYKMWIDKNDELYINLLENGRVTNEYFTVFPVKVKGTFIDELTENTTEHCITKEDYNGNRTIRISRNQLSLEPNVTQIHQGNTFYVLVRLNCIENIRSVQFTLKYTDNVEFVEAEPLDKYKKAYNPLYDTVRTFEFDDVPDIIINETSYEYITDGRFTYGILGEQCGYGSGSLAKLTFEAVSAGPAKIEFEDLFGDQNLIILDCNTNQFTKEDMPESKEIAEVLVLS